MKRIASISVILLLSCMIAAATGQKEPPAAGKAATITFMRPDAENPAHSLTKEYPQLWKYWEEASGIHVTPVDVALEQDYKQVLELKAAAGQITADIIDIRGDDQGSYIVQFVASGLLRSMDDLIDKNAPNMKAFMQKYPDYRKALTLPDGKMYSFGSAMVSKNNFMGFMIRKDWLDKLGLSMPNTLEDWYNVAVAFATRDPNGNGKPDEVGMMSSDGLWGLRNFGVAFGLQLCTGQGWQVRNGKIGFDYIRPEAKDLAIFLNKCVAGKAFPADYNDPNINFGSVWTRVTNGQLGIWVRMGPTLAGYLNYSDSPLQKVDPTAHWVPALPPLMPDGKRLNVLEPVSARWRTYAITTKGKDPAAAMRWLDFVFLSDKGREIQKYGKEGVTFKREADGTITKLVKFNEKDEIADGPLAGTWWGGGLTMPGVSDEASDIDSFKQWGVTKDVMDGLTANYPFLVYPLQVPILSPEDAKEASKLLTDVNTYRDEMWAKVVAGDIAITDASFQQYVTTIRKMGVDRIQEIYQKAYDQRK